jgi:hypothetical protein
MRSMSRPAFAGRSPLRDGAVIAGLLVFAWMNLVVGDPSWRDPGFDALVYWRVNPADPYTGSVVGGLGAYLYSPAFAQAFWLLGRLPETVFVIGWTALLAAVAIWLARPWPWALLVLAFPLSQELLKGNIHLLLAAAIVLGFRWPGTWAFVLLTKITPGVGLLWFAVRREWRALAIVAVATTAIVAASVVIGLIAGYGAKPWLDWLDLLRREGGSDWRFPVRLVAAVVIVVWGARTDRPWTVPLAAMIALPVVWIDSFSMLLGCVALSRQRSAAPTTEARLVRPLERGPDRPSA